MVITFYTLYLMPNASVPTKDFLEADTDSEIVRLSGDGLV
jgi:hypothetical protein